MIVALLCHPFYRSFVTHSVALLCHPTFRSVHLSVDDINLSCVYSMSSPYKTLILHHLCKPVDSWDHFGTPSDGQKIYERTYSSSSNYSQRHWKWVIAPKLHFYDRTEPTAHTQMHFKTAFTNWDFGLYATRCVPMIGAVLVYFTLNFSLSCIYKNLY